jgi:hypothetical protein
MSDTESLIERLDKVPPVDEDFLVLEGLLLRARAGCFRLVTEHVGFEFNIADVVAVEEVPLETPPRYGIAVQLHLRKGAQLLNVFPADHYRSFWSAGRPFALSVRPSSCQVPFSSRFRTLEEEFRQRRFLK